jgi:ADP-heptose:LPS heptosyltransferase
LSVRPPSSPSCGRQYADLKLTLVVYHDMREVAEGIEGVERVLCVDRRKIGEAIRMLWRERGGPRTLVITHSINPLVAFYLAVSRARMAAGYLWSHVYTRSKGSGLRVTRLAKSFGHLVEQHTVIGEAMGFTRPRPPLSWTPGEKHLRGEFLEIRQRVREGRAAGMRYTLIVPGSASASKTWPPESFEQTIRHLCTGPRNHLILAGSPGERELNDRLSRIAPERITNVAGKTNFTEFAALVGEVDLVICNDSAAQHLAATFKVPCIAFFGPVDPAKCIHEGPGIVTFALRGTEKCRCGHDFFRPKPCVHGTPCLRSIPVERVTAIADKVLAGVDIEK